MNYVEIAVDIPVGPNRTFTYNVPRDMRITVGQMVRVSFSNRLTLGIVFGISEPQTGSSVLDVLEVVSDEVFLTENQVILAKWISQHYYASLYHVALAMLPSGMIPKKNATFKVDSEVDRRTLGEEALRLVDYIESHANVSQTRLIKEFGRTSRRVIADLMARNIVVLHESLLPPRVGPKLQEFIAISTVNDYSQMLLDVRRSENQQRVLELLHKVDTLVSARFLRARFGSQSIRSLITKGFLLVRYVRSYRVPAVGLEPPTDGRRILSHEQASAVSGIQKALREYPENQKILLWGIAGSGKTEVYLRALAECLGRGRTAIILVPDISLTAQTVAEVVARFPGQVAVLHSGLSSGEQFDQWQQIINGEFKIVVGVRSAVFAPLKDLGLIIVDEEHDWNYKQSDREPRYHARDVAVKLSELSGAVLVLGSATPDVESYYAARHGEYTLLQMHRRPDGRIHPAVRTRVVDMRAELLEGNRSIFSRQLVDNLTACLNLGRKAILFINRRGAAQSVQCRSCGYVATCSRCEITLTYHLETDQLNCHYCGRTQSYPNHCPICADIRIRHLGLGTQRVVQELASYVPDMEIIRYDGDVARKAREHDAINAAFRSPGPKVMVGTQMLAKGLDFPDVGMVGIVLADLGLTAPNFRASERSFQLLAQVAGRAGRREDPGDVIIQTYTPDHYVVKALEKLHYVEFAMKELGYREQLRQPPFEKHLRLVYPHFDYDRGLDIANKLVQDLADIGNFGGFVVDVLGPVLAYPHKLRGRYRWQVVLRGQEPMELLVRAPVPPGTVVDVDPFDVN